MKWKPDFEQTVPRFDAWWRGEVLDRPPACVRSKPTRAYEGPVSTHASRRDAAFDLQFVLESSIAEMARHDWVGDSFPIFWANFGPEISATLFGCELEFGADTSWSSPVVHEIDDWSRIIEKPADFDNVYWRATEKLTRMAIDASEGRYAVGITDLHGNYDILAALRDPMQLCTDLLDCPDLLRRAGRHVSQGFVDAFNRQYQMLAGAGMGSTFWIPTYHRGPSFVPSCDFWCMVSDEDARGLILPDILYEVAPLERSIFHLDGPQALRHLDLLLSIPQLDAVQWVYGAGAGPARRWIDVYQRILKAGKSVQLIAQDPADALAVLDEVGVRGVFVLVEQPFATRRHAEEFCDELARRTRRGDT